jgi:uncharacterized protein (DUF983 family)
MSMLGKLASLARMRCPRCEQGAIYERGMKMHDRCTVCGLVYAPEPGYFIGSLYISYGMAIVCMGLVMYLLHLLLPTWDLGVIVLLAVVVFAPFAPLLTRYARVIWMYFDHWAWPREEHRKPT